MRYDKKGTFPATTLDELYRASAMERRERALSAELTYGTLEKLLPIDYHLEALTAKPMAKLDAPVRAICAWPPTRFSIWTASPTTPPSTRRWV